MALPIARDGWPFIIGLSVFWGLLGAVLQLTGSEPIAWVSYALAAISAAFMFYFFRDPSRVAPIDPSAVVAGADGTIRSIEFMREDRYLKEQACRISIYLSPMDVHINRAPLMGVVRDLAYTPGKHLLTYSNSSSEHNEHSSILIQGERTKCLVRQIVGPLVRRVVYWLNKEQEVGKGERIGLMKFGSRLDVYFPESDIEVLVKKGDRVRAGETVIARIRGDK